MDTDPISPMDDILTMLPEAVWHRSPLSHDAIDRILAAPHLPLPIAEDLELLRLVLAKLADLMVVATMDSRPKSKQVNTVIFYYVELLKAMAECVAFDFPPAPPKEWVDKMNEWMMAKWVPPPGVGAPRNLVDHQVYPWLLSYYELTYGRPPASTMNGPTFRFLSPFLTEMTNTFKIAQFSQAGMTKYVGSKWSIPSDDNLKRKIRDFKQTAAAEMTPCTLFMKFCMDAGHSSTLKGGRKFQPNE